MKLKTILKSIVYRAYYLGRYHNILYSRIKKNDFIPILSLHKISPERNSFWQPLHPSIFEKLIIHLKKQFEIVTLHELEQVVCKKPKLVLSFDDGYYDFIEYAMPILKKHQIKANLNIIPSQLMGEKALWNIAIYDFLNAAPVLLLKEIKFLNFDAKKLVRSHLNKTQFGLLISKTLKNLPSSERDPVIKHLEENFFSKLSNYPKTRMIRLNEIDSVISEHEIGVHSYSHNSMEFETMEYFIDDFKKCQEFFIKNHFPLLDIYAFPNGSYRPEHISYLKKNNIDYILLVDNEYASCSPYSRLNIAAYSQYEALFQALGIKSKMKVKHVTG